MVWWEIEGNDRGIEITRHAGEWKFVPNRNPGRPSRKGLVMEPEKPIEGNPLELLRARGVDIVALTFNGALVHQAV